MEYSHSKINVSRQPINFSPDNKRVVTRFFYPDDKERIIRIFDRINLLSDGEVNIYLKQVINNFSHRHRDIKRTFKNNFDKILREIDFNTNLSLKKRLFIGSYFTMEYSIEAAALFNPSIVKHPDQSILKKGRLRVILSFRAVGEGHISSIVFRKGIIKENGDLSVDTKSALIEKEERILNSTYNKKDFIIKLKDSPRCDIVYKILDDLLDEFTYEELRESLKKYTKSHSTERSEEFRNVVETLLWLANSNYEIKFKNDLSLSGRVIFPVSKNETKGIEDARFVLFTNDDGTSTYYATYTAYNGKDALPQLIETKDFCHFKISTLFGSGSQGKGMALFPEKINGKYVVISRNDNENIYIMFSDSIRNWENPIFIKPPCYYWEFFQVGNSGSPLKTDKGWLLLTHGVGPVRTYCLGAILLDINDPTKIIGVLEEPLLIPLESERNGYVPNVVYSCGAIIHNNKLVIPYAMSDTRSGVASLNLSDLFENMKYFK
ncbi:MAG: glycoside hydrolase family 130 protein [Bacteroidetes bacterium]|nr:glycoside hydrolase family 130 protein [Bacteroidota bacterium]